MAGIPPLAGFFAKLYTLGFVFSYGQFFVVICALVSSLISTYYYIKVIKILFFENRPASYFYKIFSNSCLKSNAFICYLKTTDFIFIEILSNVVCLLFVFDVFTNFIELSWSLNVAVHIFDDSLMMFLNI